MRSDFGSRTQARKVSWNRPEPALRRGGQNTNKERDMAWKRFVVMLVAAMALSACGSIGSYSDESDAGANSGGDQQAQPASAEQADNGDNADSGEGDSSGYDY
jgi:hypothetical protein